MSHSTRHRLELDDGAPDAVEVQSSPASSALTVLVGPRASGALRAVRVLRTGPRPLLLVGERVVALSAGARESAGVTLVWEGRAHTLRRAAPGASSARRSRAASGVVTAPMPGRVVQVQVRPGDQVEAGAPLIVIEAMKMQNALFAPGAGRVERVLVNEGAAIERGATLIELTLSAAAAP